MRLEDFQIGCNKTFSCQNINKTQSGGAVNVPFLPAVQFVSDFHMTHTFEKINYIICYLSEIIYK